MRRSNPFVPRDKTLQYVTGTTGNNLFTYRGAEIEVKQQKGQRLDGGYWWEWVASDFTQTPEILHSGSGVPDENAAAILARYALDLEYGMLDLGTDDDGEGWHLGNIFQMVAGDAYQEAVNATPLIAIPDPYARGTIQSHRQPTRGEVARALRVLAGRQGDNWPQGWQREAYAWFLQQPPSYQVQLIDRATEVNELKRYGMARRPKQPSFSATWSTPNPRGRRGGASAPNPNTLKKRCLR